MAINVGLKDDASRECPAMWTMPDWDERRTRSWWVCGSTKLNLSYLVYIYCYELKSHMNVIRISNETSHLISVMLSNRFLMCMFVQYTYRSILYISTLQFLTIYLNIKYLHFILYLYIYNICVPSIFLYPL